MVGHRRLHAFSRFERLLPFPHVELMVLCCQDGMDIPFIDGEEPSDPGRRISIVLTSLATALLAESSKPRVKALNVPARAASYKP